MVEDFNLRTPCKEGGSEFLFYAHEGSDVGFLGVRRDEKEFLLKVKKEGGGYLIKQDKRIRIPSVGLVKSALLDLLNKMDTRLIFSNIAEITAKQKALKNYIEPQDLPPLLQTYKKISLEIGFGSGRHILSNAQKHPDTLYIGVEIHTPSIMQVLRQIEMKNIGNLYVLSLDARVLLEVLPSNALDEIFIHFPIPWDSSPSKRILTKVSVKNIARVLKKGGFMHLRSDSPSFYKYSKALLEAEKNLDCESFSNQNIDTISKYEQRWRNQEKDIYDIYAKATAESPVIEALGSVEMDRIAEKGLKPFSARQDEIFIALKNIYAIDEAKKLVFFMGGSVHSPTKHFLITEEGKCTFFGPKPLNSQPNRDAITILKGRSR